MKKLFIGIDFSKLSFDVSILKEECHQDAQHHQFENNKEGYTQMIRWVRSQTTLTKDLWLFCGEHTGLYSVGLTGYLIQQKMFIWLENPLQIKRSSGIKREKTDKADSLDIALYAYRFQDKAKSCQLPDKSIQALNNLLAFRDRLIRNKCSLECSAKELHAVYKDDRTARFIYEQSIRDIEQLNKEIDQIEQKMLEIVQEDETLSDNYHLAVSVKGIGPINALTILVCTRNFTLFDNYRQFACYGGIAPFEHSSGSSLNKGKHVSGLADRNIKRLLTQAAKSAVIHDEELRLYYQRKIAEGKKWQLVINNVRNKLVSRVFAVVRNRKAYDPKYYMQ